MALYQIYYLLIPRKLNTNNITYKKLDTSNLWMGQLNLNSLIETIDELFVRNQWAGEKFITWGDMSTDDITLYFDNDKIESLHLRLDLRKKSNFLNLIFKLCVKLDAVMIDENNNIVEPNITSISKSMEKSNAFKFVSNPTKFLDESVRYKVDDDGNVVRSST